MKKQIIYLLFVLFAVSWQSKAQFNESFEGGTFPPANWTVINDGDANGWESNSTAHTGTKAAAISFSSDAHDDWLITPAISVVAGSTDRISFWAKNYSSSYVDKFNVKLSTTGTAKADFTVDLDTNVGPPTNYTQYEYDLSAYAGQTVYVAIQAISTDEWRLYVDDVVNDGMPSCPAPTALSVSFSSTTEANLAWTENGSATTWNIEYGPTGFTQGQGTMVNGVTSNPYTLSGLTPRTDYDFYVQADCGASGGTGTSDWAGPYTWTQPDTGDDCGVPIMGSVVQDCSQSTSLTLDFSNAISEYLSGCDGFGNYGYWVKITWPASGSLTIHNTGSDVGVVLLDACGGNELYCNNNNLGASLSLQSTSLSGADIWMYFWKDNQSGTADICLQENTCPFPSSLSADNITATSADLSWTENGSATTWNIEYGPHGYTQGQGTAVNGVTNNPYTLTGLNSGTSYDYYVQADCGGGDTSPWVGPYNFVTSCVTVTSFPYIEDFEYGIPVCWTETRNPSNSSYGWSSYDTGYSGKGLRFDSYLNSNGNTSSLTTYTLDLTSLTTPLLSFYYKNPAGGDFTVSISTDGGSNFTVLENNLTGQTDWLKKTYDLSSYITNNVIIEFKGTSNYGSGDAYIYLDEFKIEEAPACAEPANLSVANIETTQADLNWLGSANLYNIEFGTTGFTPTGNATYTGVTAPYHVTGLSGQTTYDFYVQADCGNGSTSNWVGPYTFTTLPVNNDCSGAIALTVNSTCNFETYSNLGATDSGVAAPACSSYNGGDVWFSVTVPNSGNITIDSDTGDITDGALAVYSGTCGNLTEIGCDDDSSDNGLMPKLTLNNLTPGDQLFIRFFEYGGNTFGTFQICVSTVTCPVPSNGQTTNITKHSADLSWTAGGTESAWNIEYGPTGFTQGNGTVVNASSNPYTLTGLTPGVMYDWYVQADCGGGDSSTWAGPYSFTTLPGCGGKFYDDGGPNNDYSSNLNQVVTIYPDNPGDAVTVTFNSFDMEQGWDGMIIKNGPSTGSPIISSGSTYNRANCPNGAWTGGAGGSYSADGLSFTSTDPSGALTFIIKSDSTVQHAGWDADVTCNPQPTCAGIVPDYTEDFTYYMPSCWKEAKGNPGSLNMVNSRWTYDGFLNSDVSGAARIYMYGTQAQVNDWLISPSFDLSTGSYELTFKVGVTGFSNSGGVTMGADDFVKLMVSTDGGNTWSSMTEWNSTNNPSNIGNYLAFDLSNYAGNSDVRFAYYANTGTNTQGGYNFYVDDFVISGSECAAPSNLTTTITGTTSAILSWTDNNAGSATYIVEWKPVSSTTWDSYTTAAGATSYTLTGLIADTEYQWRVTSDCGSGLNGPTVSGNNFIPTCVPIVPNYLQEFTTYLDECWMEGKGNMTSFYPANSRWTNDGFANNGSTGAARIVLYANPNDSWLISPEFDLSGGSYTLEMDVAVTGFSNTGQAPMGADDEVNVQISTDGGATWSVIYTWTAGNTPSNTGDHVAIDLSNYNGFAKFAIVASDGSTADSAYNFYVDNFAVSNTVIRPTVVENTYDINIGQNDKVYHIFTTDRQKMLNVTAYDISGREIYRAMNVNAEEVESQINVKAGSLVIFRIEMPDHSVIIKKTIKR